MAAKAQNHYEILGLWRDASDADIRRAYRHLALLYHPDVSPESGAAERFRAIQDAYSVLVDPAARASFDASLGVDVGSGRARPRTAHDAGTSSGRRASPLRSDGVPDGWTRALAAEARKSWKTLGGFLAVLALAIAACALIDRIPGIGTVVAWLCAVFVLPLLVFFIFLLQWAHIADGSAKRRTYRGRL